MATYEINEDVLRRLARLRELEEQEARREAMVEAWLNELEKDV